MKSVVPKVFIVGHTAIDVLGMQAATEHLGVDFNLEQLAIDGVSDAEILTEFAGRLCYMSFEGGGNTNITKLSGRPNAEYVGNIISQHHGSVLEHGTVSVLFADVSRVFTHELVRHRVGTAFSQVSGRYVRTDEINAYIPTCISNNADAVEIFIEEVKHQEAVQKRLEEALRINEADFGRKKEMSSAMRRLVGNGQSNHILFTANHRTLRHLTELRTAVGAEEEIRLVFHKLFELLVNRFPAIYGDAVYGDISNTTAPSIKYSKGRA